MLFLAFSTFFGLPAHPFMVHAAVVLVPLAAVLLVLTGWRAAWRKAYALPITALAVIGGVSAFLAKESGESLEESVRDAARAAGERARFGDHPEQGDTAFIFAMLFALTAIVFWAVDRFGKGRGLPAWAPLAAYGLASVVGVIAVVTISVAGHSGAELVWKDLGTFNVGR